MIDILFEIEKSRGKEEKDLSSTAQLAFCNRVGNADHQLCTVCLPVLTTLQCEICAWNFMHKIFAIVVKSVGLHLALSLLLLVLLLLLLPLLLLPLFACPMKNVGKLCNSISFACFFVYVCVALVAVCVCVILLLLDYFSRQSNNCNAKPRQSNDSANALSSAKRISCGRHKTCSLNGRAKRFLYFLCSFSLFAFAL